jgi:hypothetical protein
MKPLRLCIAIAALSAGIVSPLPAHHSFAVYDRSKSVTLTGTVKSFQWTNPHVVIWLLVAPEGGGEPQEWGIETTSPGVLTRSGWSRTSIKTGDKVTVVFYPMHDGSHGGGLNSVTLPSGQKLEASFANQEKANIQ